MAYWLNTKAYKGDAGFRRGIGRRNKEEKKREKERRKREKEKKIKGRELRLYSNFNKVLTRIWKLEMKKEGKSLELYYNSRRRYQGLRGVNRQRTIVKAHSIRRKR